MKVLSFLAVTVLAASTSAFADTKVSLDQFADVVAKNPSAMLGADNIKTTKDPVLFSVTAGSDTISTEGSAADVLAAVRAKVPAVTYHTSSGAVFVADYGRLTMQGERPVSAVYDLQKDVEDFEDDANTPRDTDQTSYVNEKIQLLSIVGNIVSFRTTGDSYGAGAAHPNSYDGFTAVDTSKIETTGSFSNFATANLGDLVDESSLVAALKADKFLNAKIDAGSRRKLRAAATLQQIGDILEEGLLNGESCYSSPVYDGKISSFAIYDYNATKGLVSVRVSMGYSSHACAGAAPTVQLGLLVKPRFDLKFALEYQAKNNLGLIMKNAK